MLNVNANPTSSFLSQPPPPQPPQPGVQGQSHMQFMSNHPGSAPGMLGGPQGANGLPNPSAYPLHMRQGNPQRAPSFGQQPHNGQTFNPQSSGAPSHMNGIGSGPAFSNQMMQPIRRVPSQGQPMNPAMAGMGGQPAVGTVAGMPGMGVNGMSMGPGHIRQGPSLAQQHPQNMRLQHHMMQGQGHIPEMNIGISRQPPQVHGSGGMMSTVMGRAPSHTFMNNPPSAQSHSAGIQPPHHPQGFQNNMGVPPAPIGSSPHISPPHNAGIIPPPLNHSNSMPSVAGNRARMTPENSGLMNHLQSSASHASRLPALGAPFAYTSSTTPPNSAGDMSHLSGTSSQGTGGRAGLLATPAQTFGQMSQSNSDGFQVSFSVPSQPPSAPLRPPSRPAPHPSFVTSQDALSGQLQQQSQQLQRPPSIVHRQSPFPGERSGSSAQVQRPQSRPSLSNGQSPQHLGQPRTPRISQPAPGHPPQTGNGVAAPSLSQQPAPSANTTASPSEQDNANSFAPPPTTVRLRTEFHPAVQPLMSGVRLLPQQQQQYQSQYLASTAAQCGPGIGRLLFFSGMLATETSDRFQLSHWQNIVNLYYLPHAVFKFTLWKDNQRTEAKPFEIGVPILPRFFLVTSQSGVKTMHLNLDGARERPAGMLNRTIVECTQAIWTFRYVNGYVVTLRGPLSATLTITPMPSVTGGPPVPVAKFESMTFDAHHHEKTISLDAIVGNRLTDSPRTPRAPVPRTPTMNVNDRGPSQVEEEDGRSDEPRIIVDRATMPAEPVNAFGIPQATMRCLELAESVAQMSDLIQFSKDYDLGPLDALKNFARSLRDAQSTNMSIVGQGASNTDANPSSPSYQGASTPSAPQSAASGSSAPQAGPSAIEPKTSKSSLAQAQAAVSTPTSAPANATTPAAASTPSASANTPHVAPATLKRKAQNADTASPTTTTHDSAPPAKRPNRKRGKTQGG
ncbi:unnamed protein product [Somion occarium]|uniref:Uncharacterized protein n=1 Tax=Somion occarium TaxID=3059160 RepID=A0ABP1D2C8_9APHY